MHGLHYIVVKLVKKCPEDKKTVFNFNDQLLICSTYVDFSILFLKQAGSNPNVTREVIRNENFVVIIPVLIK